MDDFENLKQRAADRLGRDPANLPATVSIPEAGSVAEWDKQASYRRKAVFASAGALIKVGPGRELVLLFPWLRYLAGLVADKAA
jgi:hypothetical protein